VKILKVVNIILPPLAEKLHIQATPFGGWILSMINELKKYPDLKLGVAARAPIKDLIIINTDDIIYYGVPVSKTDKYDIDEAICHTVLEDFLPDLLHIDGSEFAHAKTFMQCFNGKNVLSLQGIINGYEPHQYGGLLIDEMMFSLSIEKLLIGWSMHLQKRFFFNHRLKKERETIKLAKNIIGRTEWDKAYSYYINSEARYFHSSEILRPVFYERKWDINRKKRYSLFVGNSYSALKGAHYAIQALALIKKEFPAVHLYIAGESPFFIKKNDFKKWIGYPLYLRRLIKKLDIKQNITFLGLLSAEEIAERMLQSHIFLLCSTIENSPNTLGEAMLLGVPCVTAYVGGVPDMATDEQEALFYRDCEPSSLAWNVKKIFENNNLAIRLSDNARRKALITHDKRINVNKMKSIYETIFRNE